MLHAACVEPQHIVIALEIQPELRRCTKGFRQHERRTHGDGALAVDNLSYGGFADAQRFSKAIVADAVWLHEFLFEYLPRRAEILISGGNRRSRHRRPPVVAGSNGR